MKLVKIYLLILTLQVNNERVEMKLMFMAEELWREDCGAFHCKGGLKALARCHVKATGGLHLRRY